MREFLYKKRNILCPLLAFLIPVAVMVFICILSGFYPFGDTSILMADMRYQFVDYFGYMKKIFFSNDTLFYSFSKTLGGDMAGLEAYYCNNPFLLFLLFLPNNMLPGGILVMMIVMLGLIGLCFNIFLTEVYGSRYTTLVFSTAYAFMGYLMGYFNCVHYFFNVMMLPLVMLGIYRIIKSGKISILYIISQALSVFSSYYIGYMICIFSVCFFIYEYFTLYTDIKSVKNIKKHLKPVWIFISTSILAAMLSAVSLLCSVISLREQSSRKHIPISLKGNFNIIDFFSGFYSNVFNGNVSDDGLPLIYSGAIALIFIMIFYLAGSITKREKFISAGVFVFLILGFYVDILNVAWHGFSYPIGFPYRNSFLLSFWVLFLAYKCFLKPGEIKAKQVIIPLFICVIYSLYAAVILRSKIGLRPIYITCFYVAFIYLLIYIYKKTSFKKYVMPMFLMLALVDASYNAYVSVNAYFPEKEEDKSISIGAYRDFVDETSAIVDHINNEDSGFYRIEKLYRRSNNDAMLIGYNGMSHFSSCEAEQTMRFMGTLGFRDNGNWAFYGEGSSAFADCLLGMKYLLSQYNETPKPYEPFYRYNEKFVFLNPYALPLCFTMQKSCTDLKPEGYDKFSYQNALAGSFGYEGDDIYTKVEDVEVTLDNLNREGNTYTVIDDNKEACIRLSFINNSTDFIYMYYDADALQEADIVVNGLLKQPYFTSYGWSIRELGYYPEGESVEVLIYPGQDEITLNGFEFYYENKAAIADWYECATKDKCELTKVTSSHLTGKASSSGDKMLVFSFPYDNTWQVFVDGKKVENKKAIDGLLAVDLEKGDHSVELKYTPRGFVIGLPVSIAGIISLFIIVFYKKRRGC
ncbi:MAG: YfhO family protein [Lachnospiraceae bacterium]|nr:YfhO family protein [Lachnospiraceae bacterium]